MSKESLEAEKAEKGRAASKRYYASHTKECLAKAQQYQRAHPEVHWAANARYRRRNSEAIKAKARAYRRSHPENCKANQKRYKATHPDVQSVYYEAHRKEIIAKVNRRQAQAVRDLADSYVRATIRQRYKIETKDITPHMVQLERERMYINRAIRQKEKGE